MQNAQAFYSPARLWWYYKKNQRLNQYNFLVLEFFMNKFL